MVNPDYSIRKDDKANCFVAYSHKFDEYSQGLTEEQALSAIKNAEIIIEKITKERGLSLDQYLNDKRSQKIK